MTDEPQRFGNADEVQLTATERRDLILAVLAISRGYLELWSRWPTVQEIEDRLTGKVAL